MKVLASLNPNLPGGDILTERREEQERSNPGAIDREHSRSERHEQNAKLKG